jgi:tripartite-type tricarboxylate transporter receptor subunit TctC
MCLWLAGLGSAAALDYPSRPIMMIVPYPPGGQGDTIGRIVAERMRTTLGQPVIIENVGGASGSIGVGRVARAAPDGYMLVLGSFSNMVVSGAVFDLKYDLLKDFEPVALLPTQPFVIVARKTMPATNLKELIAWLKANPDKASQGTSGFGAASHLAGVLFQKETGTRYPFVNYRGTAMQDLVAGHIDLMIDNASTALPQVRAGTIKAYAVASKHRLAAASDIPTVDEAGLPGYYMSLWNGFWVPKGTPEPIIAKLNAATVDALSDPVAQHQLGQFGLQLYSREQETPEALGALQRAEIAKWWPIIKAAGIKVE